MSTYRIYATNYFMNKTILSDDGNKEINRDELFLNNDVSIDEIRLKKMFVDYGIEISAVDDYIKRNKENLEKKYTKVEFIKRELVEVSSIIINDIHIPAFALYVELKTL